MDSGAAWDVVQLEVGGAAPLAARWCAAGRPGVRAPAVLALAEARHGAWLDRLAARLARAGCHLLAPQLPVGASDRRVLAELEATLRWLAERPDVAPGSLAVLGTGAGGRLAFLLACASTAVAVAVDVHGEIVYPELDAARPMQPLEMALNLSAPLLALYAGADPQLPSEHVERLRATMTQFSKRFELHRYPAAAGGFLDAGRPGYDGAAAEDAQLRILRFLGEELALETER